MTVRRKNDLKPGFADDACGLGLCTRDDRPQGLEDRVEPGKTATNSQGYSFRQNASASTGYSTTVGNTKKRLS